MTFGALTPSSVVECEGDEVYVCVVNSVVVEFIPTSRSFDSFVSEITTVVLSVDWKIHTQSFPSEILTIVSDSTSLFIWVYVTDLWCLQIKNEYIVEPVTRLDTRRERWARKFLGPRKTVLRDGTCLQSEGFQPLSAFPISSHNRTFSM